LGNDSTRDLIVMLVGLFLDEHEVGCPGNLLFQGRFLDFFLGQLGGKNSYCSGVCLSRSNSGPSELIGRYSFSAYYSGANDHGLDAMADKLFV
jgi:hypothetical protein